MMRYSKAVVRRSLAIVASALLCACASAQPQGPSGLERAVAEDEDLGDPRSASEDDEGASQARAQALLHDPDAEHIDFDGDEQNDAPVDMVTIPPDRSPSKSFMQDIVMGPS